MSDISDQISKQRVIPRLARNDGLLLVQVWSSQGGLKRTLQIEFRMLQLNKEKR